MWEDSEKNEELLARFEQMLEGNFEAFFDAEHYEYALQYYLENKAYPKALKTAEKALQFYPFTVSFMTEKAKVLTLMGKLTEANQLIRQAQELAPYDMELVLVKAELLWRTGKFEQLLDCCQKALSFENEHENLFKLMALAHQGLGNEPQALHYFVQSFRLNPDNEDAFDEIYKLVNAQNIDQYLSVFEQLTDQEPYSVAFWEKLGLLLNKTDRYEQALQAFEYTTLIDERFARGYFYMGNAHMNLKNYHQAAQCYRQALVYESHADFYCHLGASLEKLKQYEQAIKYYQKAFALDANYAEACYGIGVCLDKCSRWFEAIHYLKKAVQINEESGYFWYALATVEYKMGNVLSALQAYEKANRFWSSPELWLDWSYIFYEQDSTDEAVALLKEALQELPQSAEILYRISAYLLLQNKFEQALTYLSKALSLAYDRHHELLDLIPPSPLREALVSFITKYSQNIH